MAWVMWLVVGGLRWVLVMAQVKLVAWVLLAFWVWWLGLVLLGR